MQLRVSTNQRAGDDGGTHKKTRSRISAGRRMLLILVITHEISGLENAIFSTGRELSVCARRGVTAFHIRCQTVDDKKINEDGFLNSFQRLNVKIHVLNMLWFNFRQAVSGRSAARWTQSCGAQ